MTSVWPFKNYKCEQIESLKETSAERHIIYGCPMFCCQMIAIYKKITQISELMAAILNFTQERGFPNEHSGGVLWVFLHGPTESNSVEKPSLAFLSIKKCLLPGLKTHMILKTNKSRLSGKWFKWPVGLCNSKQQTVVEDKVWFCDLVGLYLQPQPI